VWDWAQSRSNYMELRAQKSQATSSRGWDLESSALVKLVLDEPGSGELRQLLTTTDNRAVSCDLLRTEVLRACRRHSPESLEIARRVLESVDMMSLSAAVFDRAGILGSPLLRSLDAIHLAAALELGDDLTALVTYDLRLAEGAHGLGLAVASP